MNSDQIVQAIQTHGLSIRQIPFEIVSLHDMRHHQPGNEIVESRIEDMTAQRYAWIKKNHENPNNFRFDDEKQEVYRFFSKQVTVPNNAGFWMCKKANSTASCVEWSSKTDNLAPTLAQSIEMFLEKELDKN